MQIFDWYTRDSWISGWTCGIYAMLFGGMIVRAIFPKR